MRSYTGNVWAEESKKQGHGHHASVAVGRQPRPFLLLQLVMEHGLEATFPFYSPVGQDPRDSPIPASDLRTSFLLPRGLCI